MKFNFFALLTAFSFLIISCKPSVTTSKTPSGYEYSILTEGTGEGAKTDDYVFFTAKITGSDSVVINEIGEGPQMPSLQIPAEFAKGKEANPILEMLNGAKVGSVYKLVMPMDSFPQASPEMAKLKFMEYEIGVKKILNKEQYEKYQADQQAEMQAKAAANQEKLPAIEELVKTTLADYKAGKLETKATESGLKYYVVKAGEGANAMKSQSVTVNYYGTLMDGTMFDNSFQRGQSFPFTLGTGQVIKGWDEGIAQLNKGTKAFLFIPAAFGYGEAGSPPVIPANSDLMFYVELEDITGK
jgi:FKBP-type peptidyl-prolyl cis-trans isomerase FkpA